MRKRLGVIVLGAIVISFIIVIFLYYQIPKVKEFIDANTTLVAFLSLLIAIPPFLHLFLSERKKTERETTEKEVSEKETTKKGVSEEDQIEKEISTITSPISGLCIGRDTELSQLEKDLKHKNVLLIKGIAGIGKTTLGHEFRDILEKKGYHR